MKLFELILAMLALAVLLVGVARRLGVPYPVLLAVAGAGLAVAPFRLDVHLDPTLVLALFVAPVLLDASYDASLRDLKRSWRAVTSLALFAVGVTTAAVAVLVHWMIPGIPWAAAVAIGAVVAPPDAVSATAVLASVGVPHRIKTILEGEALLNDASVLLIYRLALSAVAAGGSVTAEAIAPAFLLSIVGSLVAGPLLALVVKRIVHAVTDAPASVILQFVSTFGVWVLAERAQLSPILTLVAYGMTLARGGPGYQPAAMRVPSYAVWDTAVLVLNVLAFLLIGLELEPVLAHAPPGALARWAGVGAGVLATVIAVRLAWSLLTALIARWRLARAGVGDASLPDWRSGLFVGWAGARGIVTVATALALPAGFPSRDALLFVALFVTLGTLVVQGATMRPLIAALGLGRDDVVDGEVRRARIDTADAALAELGDRDDRAAKAIRRELEGEREVAAHADAGDGRPTFDGHALRADILRVRRRRLLAMRDAGTIGDDAFHALEEEFDLAELATATRT